MSPLATAIPVLIVADAYTKRLYVAATDGRVVTIDPQVDGRLQHRLPHVIGGSTMPHQCVVRVACTRHAGIARNKKNGGAAGPMVCRTIGARCIIDMGALEGTLGNDSPVTNRHMLMGPASDIAHMGASLL